MGWGSYRLRDVCRKGYMVMEDWIVIAGAGLDAVTCHVIVTVITSGLYRDSYLITFPQLLLITTPASLCFIHWLCAFGGVN